MKIWKIYEEIKEKAGVKKVDPENIQKIREVLSFPSLEEIDSSISFYFIFLKILHQNKKQFFTIFLKRVTRPLL